MFSVFGMRVRSVAASIGLVCALACDSALEPGRPDAFVSAWQRSTLEAEAPFAVSSATGIVYVDGHLVTPDPCYGFAATVARGQSELDITLHAERSSPGCIQPLTAWNFRVTVPRIPSGTWRVRMRTRVGTSSTATPVLDTLLTVP